jgi:1,2-diacylglycerol 3-alpha-glucosyltransferase
MISDVYFPRVNGVSTSIRVFTDELRRQGHSVAIAAPSYGGTPAGEGDEVARAAGWRVPFDPEDRVVLPGRLFAAAKRAGALLGGSDVIHVHTPFAALRAGRRLAAETGALSVATHHTHFEANGRHYVPWLPDRWLAAAARRLAKGAARAVDLLVAPTEPLRDVLLDYGVLTPIRVVPTGLDLERFARVSAEARATTRSRLGVADHEVLLLHVGRLAFEKDVSRVLRVAAAAMARHPEARCVIAGEGPARATLEREAGRLDVAGRIRFLGNLDRERELPGLYAAGDVLLSASTTETQGLVLLEAMAAGLPVVGVAALGTRALLDAQLGCRASIPDDVALLAALEPVLGDAGLRQLLGHEARTVSAAWSIENTAAALLVAYREAGEMSPSVGLRGPR